MPRQLNVRVSEEFAARLEQLARKTGRSMGALLEDLGAQSIDYVEQDMRFEAEALQAWEDYQLTGKAVSDADIDAMFAAAHARAAEKAEHKDEA
jgi:predicted transcriptional regulator